MATMHGGPHMPLGYDWGLDNYSLDDHDDDNSLSLQLLHHHTAMTPLSFDNAVFFNLPVSNEILPETHVRSPGRQSVQATVAPPESSYSLSPAGDAPIYTPTSIDYDDDNFIESFGSGPDTYSPNSSHQTDDIVHSGSDGVEPARSMSNRPPQQPALSPSSQHSVHSHSSSLSHPSQSTRTLQWQSSMASSSEIMDNSFAHHPSPLELSSSTGAFFDESFATFPGQDENLSFATSSVGNVSFSAATAGSDHQAFAYPDFRQPQHVPDSFHLVDQSSVSFGTSPSKYLHPGALNADNIAYQQALATSMVSQPLIPFRTLPSNAEPRRRPAQDTMTPANSFDDSVSTHLRRQPYLQSQPTQPPHVHRTSAAHRRPKAATNADGQDFVGPTFSARPSASYSGIVKREAQPPSSTAAVRAAGSSHTERTRRGGRTKNTHLEENVRQKTHVMRRVGACWRCIMQRDSCDSGNPCTRCNMQSQRGQAYFFDCDRSKLPDFVHEFLPPTMTLVHQKQTIEDDVKDHVLEWDRGRGIDILLCSGYGPPLRWRVYEFLPSGDELINQMQFYTDASTKQTRPVRKWSPPLGLLKIDTSDEPHFDTYLDLLLERQNLCKLGWSCYEEETMSDGGAFQAKLLHLMCVLHIQTDDEDLKSVLGNILRMVIIDYIINHTMTIHEATMQGVMAHIRHTEKPQQFPKHTSPRLATRQLKFFFTVMRNKIYLELLKWLQHTLHNARGKESTWLRSFCVMLGFAMALEEVQRSLHVQAEFHDRIGKMRFEESNRIACNAAERIDERFKLLIGLFQCKYRDRKWNENGSFGNQTPQLPDPVQNNFLRQLRSLVVEREDHLRRKQNVPLAHQAQCHYTTRLTAKFLLPFLSLPVGSTA